MRFQRVSQALFGGFIFFFLFSTAKKIYIYIIYYIYYIKIKIKKIKAANTTETAYLTNFRAIFNFVIYFFIFSVSENKTLHLETCCIFLFLCSFSKLKLNIKTEK